MLIIVEKHRVDDLFIFSLVNNWTFSTTIERFLTSYITLISCFWLSLFASLRNLSFLFSLVLEERSSDSENWSFVRLNLFVYYSFYITFFLFLLGSFFLIELFLNILIFFHKSFSNSFALIDRRMIAMFHPPMTHRTVHASWTFWKLNRLNFIWKVPIWTFFRFILILGRFSPIILYIVSIRALSSIMTRYIYTYSWV